MTKHKSIIKMLLFNLFFVFWIFVVCGVFLLGISLSYDVINPSWLIDAAQTTFVSMIFLSLFLVCMIAGNVSNHYNNITTYKAPPDIDFSFFRSRKLVIVSSVVLLIVFTVISVYYYCFKFRGSDIYYSHYDSTIAYKTYTLLHFSVYWISFIGMVIINRIQYYLFKKQHESNVNQRKKYVIKNIIISSIPFALFIVLIGLEFII